MKLGGEEGSVLIQLFQWLCRTEAGSVSRAHLPYQWVSLKLSCSGTLALARAVRKI